MKSYASNLAFAIGVIALSTACHSVRRGEPIVGPMQLNSKQERGRVVFQQRCNQCHPNGEAGLGPALNNKPAPVFLMKTQVRLGLGAMPRFGEHTISKSELDDLMAYVIALRKADKEAKPEKEKKVEEKKSDEEESSSSRPARQTK
jgi:mono/diheme cytochrome c family protein